MSDNLAIRRPQDPTKINIKEDWEVRYWTRALGVAAEQLKQAVQEVGPLVVDVKRRLGVR